MNTEKFGEALYASPTKGSNIWGDEEQGFSAQTRYEFK